MPGFVTDAFCRQLKEMAERGYSARAIQFWASEMGFPVSLSMVNYHICDWKHPQTSGTSHKDRYLQILLIELMREEKLCLSQVTALLLARHGVEVCPQTVQRAWNASLGWHLGLERLGSCIREINMVKPVTHALQWNENKEFDNLLFTNETPLELENFSSLLSHCGLYVWAGISTRGPGPLAIYEGPVTSTFFNDHVICARLVPWLKRECPQDLRQMAVLMDQDPKNLCAASVLAGQGVRWQFAPLEYPPINPIKMIWSHLHRWLRYVHKPLNRKELVDGITTFWVHVLTQPDCETAIYNLNKMLPGVMAQRPATNAKWEFLKSYRPPCPQTSASPRAS